MLLNSGKLALMNVVGVLQAAGVFKLALFGNNYTVIATTTLADLTPVPGFADQTLSGATNAVLVTGPRGQATWFPTNHHNGSGSPQTIYGWYVYDQTTGNLWSAGNFLAPITVATGATLTLNPYAQDDTL